MSLAKLGFHKCAKVSVKKLMGMLDGEAPLFHMVHPSNQESFINSKKIFSPFEAKARGLLKSVEGGWGTHRADIVSSNMGPTKHVVGKNAVRIPGKELVKYYGNTADASAYNYARMSAKPPEVGQLSAQRAINAHPASDVAGKNWSTISTTSKAPSKAYGGVGIMSNPKKVRGGGIVGDDIEQHISPEFHMRGGAVHHITLPEMRGTTIYNPSKVDRATARRLKAEGAIAINSRLMRKLKGYKKTLPPDSLPYKDWRTGDWEENYIAAAFTTPNLSSKDQRLADRTLPFFKNYREQAKK